MKSFILFFGFILCFSSVIFSNKSKVYKLQPVLLTDTTAVFFSTTFQLKQNKIPDSVFRMINLKHLHISGMDCDYIKRDEKGNDITQCWMLRGIPPQIKNLKKLEILELPLNAIHTIPLEIGELKSLKVINLTDNSGLQDIENITKLTNLEELYLFGCNLSKLPESIKNLKKLKKIGLAGNNIHKTEIKNLKKSLPYCEIVYSE